jgi:hypothetical protein
MIYYICPTEIYFSFVKTPVFSIEMLANFLKRNLTLGIGADIHPTGFVVGREESVIFIESLINNIINGEMLEWN